MLLSWQLTCSLLTQANVCVCVIVCVCVCVFVCPSLCSNDIYCNLCSCRGGRGVADYKAVCCFVSISYICGLYMWVCVHMCVCMCVCVCVSGGNSLTCTFQLPLHFDTEAVVRAVWSLPLPVTLSLIISLSLSGLMSALSVGSEMQTPAPGPQFTVGPPGKVPGRKRGRPPIRKLEFQSHYVEPLSQLKVPKKRGRKPGFKVTFTLLSFREICLCLHRLCSGH